MIKSKAQTLNQNSYTIWGYAIAAIMLVYVMKTCLDKDMYIILNVAEILGNCSNS